MVNEFETIKILAISLTLDCWSSWWLKLSIFSKLVTLAIKRILPSIDYGCNGKSIFFSPVHLHFPADDGQDHGHVAQDGEDDDGGKDNNLCRVQLCYGWLIRSCRISGTNAGRVIVIAFEPIVPMLASNFVAIQQKSWPVLQKHYYISN